MKTMAGLLIATLFLSSCISGRGSASPASRQRPHCYTNQEEIQTQQALAKCEKWPAHCERIRRREVTQVQLKCDTATQILQAKLSTCSTQLDQRQTTCPRCSNGKFWIGMIIGISATTALGFLLFFPFISK